MAVTASNASQFYESLPNDDAEAFKMLKEIVQSDNPLQEAEWIEYKSGFDKKAREHWSKGLSGFANSGGGILIWGIQTKPKDNYDIPDKIVLVANAKELAGKLDTWKSTVVDPPVLGTEVRAILWSGEKGFVVAYIPESSLKPHQAKAEQCHGQYYIRVGHQTLPTTQPLLRTLFYPQFNPVLSLIATTIDGGVSRGHTVSFRIRNEGVATLYDIYAVIDCQNEKLFFAPDETYVVREWKTENITSVVGKRYLHPETMQNLGSANMHFDTVIIVSVYGRDMKPFRWTVAGTPRPGVFEVEQIASR